MDDVKPATHVLEGSGVHALGALGRAAAVALGDVALQHLLVAEGLAAAWLRAGEGAGLPVVCTLVRHEVLLLLGPCVCSGEGEVCVCVCVCVCMSGVKRHAGRTG
jgi:hypothetical protein